jgi:hypothetical protein
MYGTVYGIATPVIHVAHPVPAKAILSGETLTTTSAIGGTFSSSSNKNDKTTRRRSSISFVHLTGASKAPAYNHFKNFCGEGVFTADGEDWKAKRAAVIHCLIKGTNASGSEMATSLEREANHAANVFCQQVQSFQTTKTSRKKQGCGGDGGSSADGNDDEGIDVPNIVPLLQRATVGLIYRYITHHNPDWTLPEEAIGSNCDYEGAEAESISLASSEEGDPVSSRDDDEHNISSKFSLQPSTEPSSYGRLLDSYLKSIVRIRMIILAQSRSIWFVLPRWCYRIFSSLHQDEEKTLDPIREFAKVACENAKPQSPLHRLSTLEGPYNPGESGILKRSDDRYVVNKNLLDEAITLLFAGQDTSAATLSWTLHLLSLYPKVQDTLAQEIQSVLNEEIGAAKPNDTMKPLYVNKKMISKLPYLDAVIKESMRLYPVAPFIVRRLTDTVLLPREDNVDSSMTLPSDSVACIWIYGLHRNPDIWAHPDDFIPERWLDANLKDPGQSNGAYMPFALGPRNCLGQPLAHIVLRTILTKLIHQYEFIDPKLFIVGDDVKTLRKEMQAGFTVLPTGGVELVIKNRATRR